MGGCGRCGAPTPQDARFCPACGAALAAGPQPGLALKTVTVLFTDMVDSTSLGERFDPESLHEVMREYFAVIQAVVQRYGGTVEKFIGDAVVGVFGIPALHEDDALRAVTAAEQIHGAVAELSRRLETRAGITLKLRTGVNTGEVLSQSAETSTGRLVGDAVNVAARLQQAAAPGEILIGPATHHLVRDAVQSDALGPIAVKGRSAAVTAHRLVRVLPVTATPERPHLPIVGRDREVRLLRETLERVVDDRTPHLFTVLGAPGVGKSRLVAELARSAPALVLQGRCLPYGEGITYWPLAEIVQTAAGIESGDAPEAARDKLTASAGGNSTVAGRVAQVVGLSASDGGSGNVVWAVAKWFESLARQQPLVVVFDDVHWAEPALLDLLDHLVDTVHDVPLLVVCTARLDLLELRPTWGGGKMNASSLVLGPLREPDCRALLGSLLGDSPAVDEVTNAVFRVADGNPLFVEEMVSMLVEDGLLEKVEGRWAAARDLASVAVPPTIQALVSARLDRLTREEREVVGIAAVMGKVFAPSAVTHLAPAPVGAQVEATLGRLTRKQLVTPGGIEFAGDRTFAFRHLLIRDTAYEHLPRQTRATIHERYAEWLVQVLGDRLAEYDEVVGYHLEQAHLYRRQFGADDAALAARASERLAEGGRRAAARQDADAAAKLLTRAADLLREPARRLGVLPDLGRALYENGDYGRSIEVLEEAMALASAHDDAGTEMRCRVFAERARIHRDPQVNAEESRQVAEAAIETLLELGDHDGLCYAWDLVAYVHDCAGRAGDALEAQRQAARHAEASGDVAAIGYQKRTLLQSLAWGPGTVAEVVPLAKDLMEWSRARSDRYSQVRALLTLAQAHAMLGDFDLARGLLQEQRTLCDDPSLRLVDACGAFERSEVALLAGDAGAAEAEARAGCDFLQRKSEKAILPTLQAELADLIYRRGDIEEAEALARQARSLSAPDDSLTEMKWRAVLAKVRARQGAFPEALDLAREAVSVGSGTGYVDWHAGVLVDLGEVLTLAGRRSEAVEAYEKAAALYARKGNVVRRRLVERLLDDARTSSSGIP